MTKSDRQFPRVGKWGSVRVGDCVVMSVPLRGWRRLWAWMRGRPLVEVQTFKVTAAAGE